MDEKRKVGGEEMRKGMLIFSRVSGLIIGPVVFALLAGKYLDQRFGTEPYAFIALTALTFIFSMRSIYRVILDYAKKIQNGNEISKPQ